MTTVWSTWPRNIHAMHLFHRGAKIVLPDYELKRMVIVSNFIFFQIHEGMMCGFKKEQLQCNHIVQSQSMQVRSPSRTA